MTRRLGAWIATALTRILLWTYPASFRKEMGRQIVDDVRCRAGEFEGFLAPLAMAAWVVRLSASLVVNAIGAWRERPIGFSTLDLRLAVRMLVRYPGLTVVAGLSMAFAIWASASAFEFFRQVLRPHLPLEGGDRVVSVVAWDAVANRPEERLTREFLAWRDEVRTLELFGAYFAEDLNLVVDGAAYPVSAAEISPAAFRLVGVAPLRGRVLVDADAQTGAPSVVVLGHDVWQQHLGADSSVVGRAIRLGSEVTTVVGVMPEGFAFPMNQAAWTPLRLDNMAYDSGTGRGIELFGRLAPGATFAQARAEFSNLAARTATGAFRPGFQLRTDVVRYGSIILGGEMIAAVAGLNLVPVLLLLLIAANVALLMFARAASRENELTVRAALGASRRRIVVQLFVEALVLGGLAALVGLAATGVGLRWLMGMFEAEVLDGAALPFWFSDRVSATTIAYTGVITVGAALVAGVTPALRLTRGLAARLRRATAGGGGMKLGGGWTAVIVVQVACTVVFPTVALAVFRDGMSKRNYEIGIAAEEFLGIEVRLSQEPERGDTTVAAFHAQYRETFQELAERVRQDPSVLGVTYASGLPRTYHLGGQVEVDVGAVPVEDPRGHRVANAAVDVDYFDVLGAPVLEGRGFTLADLDSGAAVVLVDQPFVNRVLGGANPIGRRIRYVTGTGTSYSGEPLVDTPWYEIVGLAQDLGVRTGYGYGGIYHPTRPGASYPLRMILHVRGDPEAFAPRVRAIAAELDPRLALYEPLPLDEATRISEDAFYDFWITLAVVVSALALLISLSAIYSVMSFTVVRRTREIGVRVALGGGTIRVIGAVLRRPLMQVGAGIALGLVLTWGLRGLADGYGARALVTMAGYGLLMTAVCATACVVPARRVLAVEPAEALQGDG